MGYHLEGRLLEVCNCEVLCPCWIGENPDNGYCQSIMAWNFGTGDRKAVYYRMPAMGILVFGPLMGLLYAIFLQFIGIAMPVKLVIQKVVGEVSLSTRSAATFGWRPSESYLAGKKNSENKESAAEPGESEKHD